MKRLMVAGRGRVRQLLYLRREQILTRTGRRLPVLRLTAVGLPARVHVERVTTHGAVLRAQLRVLDFLLKSGRASVENDQKFVGQLLQQLLGNGAVDVRIPGQILLAFRYLPVGPLAHEVNAEAGDHRGFVLQAHGGEMQTVGRHEVGRLREVFARVGDVAELDDERVRMLDGDVEAQGHQQDILVADQFLRLLGVHLRAAVGVRLAFLQAHLRHLDDVLELTGLLFDLGGQEEGGRGDRVTVEQRERVKTVETVHVDDGGVDAQLGDLQSLAHVLYEVGRLLALRKLLVRVDAATSARRVFELLFGKVPSFVRRHDL